MSWLTQLPVDLDEYPTSDGKPMAETDLHRDLMIDLIRLLKHRYRNNPNTYVSGNLLMFYEPGNRRRHISPDVFVVHGIPNGRRDNYLIWKEGKPPNVVIELTSRTTSDEDVSDKFERYRDVLRVPEYFLFDPRNEYLQPPFQGHRLVNGEYIPIAPIDGRLPSEELGLHLEASGSSLLLFDPLTGEYVSLPEEEAEQALEQTREDLNQAHQTVDQIQRALSETQADRDAKDREIEVLRRELDELRKRTAT